jgi:hypothetical protein
MSKTTIKIAKLTRPTLLVGLLFLSACTYLPGSQEAPPCPLVLTLGDAGIITRYIDGPGRDMVDLDFTGRISNLSGKCFYEIDPETGEGEVRLQVNSQFQLTRGAGNKTREATFKYFVSLLDTDGNVLNKMTFPFTAKYWKNRATVKEHDKTVELTIPLKSGLTGEDFSIFVGFQLSREEVDFNRGKNRQ